MEARETVDLMVDFETLGTTKDAVKLSVGVVVFGSDSVKEEYYYEFDVLGQISDGFRVQKDTVDWWNKTDKAEFERLLYDGTYDVDIAINGMVDAIRAKYNVKNVWSRHPMDFDMINYHLERPFPYFMFRDEATIRELYDHGQVNNHNALDDAHNQVANVMEVRKRWRDVQAAEAQATEQS